MRNRIICLMGLFMLTLWLSGCAKQEKEAEVPPIQVALSQDLLSLDPIMAVDIFSEPILRCVYTTLFDFDEDLRLRNRLAQNVESLDDRTWKITIRDQVKFHDGSPLTSADVVYSIRRAMAGGKTQKLLEQVEKVEKVDDFSFLISTREPYPGLLYVFAKPETSIVSQNVVDKPGYDFAEPVGAGPFELISREPGSRVKLKRFDGYYLGKAASPYLDFVILQTEQERTSALLNGDVDILYSVSSYDCEKLSLSGSISILKSPSTKVEYLALNTHHAPFDQKKVRQAIDCAINRERVTEEIYGGYSTPSRSIIPKGITGYVEAGLGYDPEKAKILLAEAGYADGFEMTVMTNDSLRKNALEYIKLDLEEVGIQLNYSLVDTKTGTDRMLADEHQSILVGWTFSSDPDSALPLIFGTDGGKTTNSSNYGNPEVDLLLAEGRSESDDTKRQAIYSRVNEILMDDAPVIMLHHPMVLSAARKGIGGVLLNPRGILQYDTIYRESSR